MHAIQHKIVTPRVSILLMTALAAASMLGTARWLPMIPQETVSLRSPLMFLENTGQLDPSVRFQAHGEDAAMFLANGAIWFSRLAPSQTDEPSGRGVNIRQTFVGANANTRLEPYQALETRVTYLKGDAQQPTTAQAWAGVRYVDLYPGIDLLLSSEAGQLVQQLVARPGADLGAVRLQVNGAEHMSLENGQLQLETAVGAFALPLLTIGADAGQIALQPALHGNIVSAPFAARAGNPVTQNDATTSSVGLIYGARFGGSDYDRGNSIAVDGQGATYVVGGTLSPNLPTTPGAFDGSFNGDVRDAFVAKLNPAGSAPEYIAYIGGQKDDWGLDIAVDTLGEAFITGYTASADFPLSQPIQGYGGQFDAFVAKLAASGGSLQYATFLGGGGNDRAYAIAIDKLGAAYVAGSAGNGFPLFNPADGSCTSTDGFVVKLNPAGTARDYATCLGGSASEYADGIAVNNRGEAYVSGVTRSSDFPATPNAYDRSYHGGDDIFIAKLNASGNSFQYATYLGDTGDDVAGTANISLTSDGTATISGYTNSPNFPTTGQAYDRSYNGLEDAIAATISASGSELLYSTFLGGAADDRSYRVVRTSSGTLYVGGETGSSDFPVTPNAFDRSFGGGNRDVFLTQISGNNALGYSTFYGGGGDDNGGAFVIAGNPNGDDPDIAGFGSDDQTTVYMTGATSSYDFPGTLGAYSAAQQGSSDTFVAKFQIQGNAKTPTNTPTSTPTNTPTNTPTDTPTRTPTNTQVPSPTPTLRAGETAPPTSTATKTPPATKTPTRTPTATSTSTATRTTAPTQAAETSVPTITPYNTPTTAAGATTEPGVPPSAPQPTPTVARAPATGRAIFVPIVSSSGKPIMACSDLEDNDTPAQARVMSPIGETCTASFRDDPEGEDDYYIVNVRAGQTLQINLGRIPTQADYDLVVYNASLAQVAVSNKSGNADEQVTYVAPQTGNYFIRINMARESLVATNDYQLSVSVR